MPPRPSQMRRTLGPQEHIYELGVAGRKTGITLPDSGIRDEHGMEPLGGLFSPDKTAQMDEDGEEGESDENDTGEAMDITTTSGIGPAALLNGHGNRLPMPLPRSRSPVKTSLNSPAQRNRLLARSSHSSSPQESSSQPTNPKRRLDFKSLDANGPRSSSQPILGKNIPKLSALNGSARGVTNGYHSQPSYRQEDSEEEEEERADEQQPHWDDHEEADVVDNFVEESMAMLEAEPGASPEPEEHASESSAEEESTHATAANQKPGPKLSQRGGPKARAGKASAAAKLSKPSPVAKAPKNRRVMEEEEESEAHDESAEEEHDQEDEAVVSEEEEGEVVAPKPRGKAAKRKAPTPEPEPRPRKRRSLDQVEEAEQEDASRQKKRQRGEGPPAPAPKARGRPKKVTGPANEEPNQPRASTSKKAGKAPVAEKAEKGKRGRKRKSSINPGDVSQVIVPRGPPLPRSRGLMINRRELPGDSNSMIRTRSGRTSTKPTAFWKNERIVYETEEATNDAFFGSKPSKFVLPSIKEVVRYDEPEPVYPTKSRKGKRGAPAKGRGRRGKSRGGYDSDDDDGPPVDPWENRPGTIEGNVICWLPEHELDPPAQDDFVDIEPRQLALSSAAVQTQPVKDATFRYAKILSEGFFNCGVVDLPPGAEKRPKNSRKMFMTFFVHTGRVLVTVNETSFRISKGGMWFVPRGNYYSIENDYDRPARIFFSQGCEMAPPPIPSVEEEPAEEGDEEGEGDEEDEDEDEEEE
ncbi:kinetochore CENP-C fungal-like protein [Immersiella caudata]|uniref:CENP-C homolog n=1 Tax=Immersiella caudata TaxID=314043 RepID=A0AA39X2W5_9PEZI|nr:kinetochore CENP-C fungal-like protein [Immersiella caudata]